MGDCPQQFVSSDGPPELIERLKIVQRKFGALKQRLLQVIERAVDECGMDDDPGKPSSFSRWCQRNSPECAVAQNSYESGLREILQLIQVMGGSQSASLMQALQAVAQSVKMDTEIPA